MNKHELLSSTNQSITPQTLGKLPTMTKLALQREGGEVIKDVIVANLHEQGRALLANTALENLGSLSALEAHLTQIAPHGEERYRHIVDAFALGAAQKIARW
jgi:hypothetical protein